MLMMVYFRTLDQLSGSRGSDVGVGQALCQIHRVELTGDCLLPPQDLNPWEGLLFWRN